MSHVSGRPRNLVQRLSPVILRVLQFCIKIPYTSGESHCIKFRGLVDNFTLKMTLWKKASAAVGLSGLTPREAARGALTYHEFQNMPDPLDKDPFGPVVVKAEVRNIFYSVL